MAEKKTTKKTTASKKAAKQSKPQAVDMVSPVTPADETGLELTEKMVMQEVVSDDVIELENPSTDAIKQAPDDAELVFENKKEIEPKETTVEREKCEEPPVTDDHDAEACSEGARNQELDLNPEPMFKEDKVMVNDITNILNGLDGVRARKLDTDAEEEEKKEEKQAVNGKNTTNTEEKNYYSEQFSRNWGGVMYDY